MIKEENLVVAWISNHQKPLAIFRQKVREQFSGKSKELKKASGSHATLPRPSALRCSTSCDGR